MKCKVWSLKCTHEKMPLILWKTTQKYCACHKKRLSTRYQTGCNVTKCRACHAKRHDNLLGNLRKGEVLQLPPDTARPQENQRLETRHVGGSKRAFRARIPPIFTLCSFKIDVFQRVFLIEPEILLPQNRCFVTGFCQFSSHLTKCHACHGICRLTQPCQCDLQKTRNTARLKCCACHAKQRWARPK